MNAVEGFGKTSTAAHAPNPAILMARGESGYLTLLGAKRVPPCPAIMLDSWDETLAMVDSLDEDPQGRQTVVLDALGGFERLCHEKVCQRDFGGDWGEKGFMSFHKGYHQSVGEWLKLIAKLDRLRERHGIAIIFLSHSLVKSFKNPMGEDFDRYIADCHEKTWGVTHKWADAVLFGNFATVVEKKDGKTKGIGGTERRLYCERRDAFDAKNRYGMKPAMVLPDSPLGAWTAIWDEIKGA